MTDPRGASAPEPPAPQQTNPEKGLTVQQRKVAAITQAVEDRSAMLLQVMPEGMNPDRFVRTTLIAISRDPKLLECTTESLVIAIFEAAECGIEPTGSLGRGYLVPIKDHGIAKANFWIGYPGYIDLAMRSERVSKVWSRAVFNGDRYEVHYGTRDEIVHEPGPSEPRAGDLTDVYACVQYKDGVVDFEPLTKEQVDLVRARARGASLPDSPWNTDYIEQARKTAIRKLAKRMPLTPEAARAIQKDEEREFGFEGQRLAAEKSEKRADSLGDALRKRAGRPQTNAEPEVAPTATSDVSATQQAQDAAQAGAATVSAPTSGRDDGSASPTEQVEGEVVCDDESPYEDGARCVLTSGHKRFHKGTSGATWGR